MLSRRKILKAGSGAAAMLGLPFLMSCKKNSGRLRVLNWRNYGTDEAWAIQAFKDKTGILIEHEYYTSETDMLEKLSARPSAYDVVQINCAWNNVAVGRGLIQPIDPSKIGHFGDLNPVFRDSDRLVHDGKYYGLSWVWGITGIAYNNETITTQPQTIQVLWDSSLAGRIAVRDDAIEMVGIGAIATGQDMNHPGDLDAVKQKLLALKPQLAALWSSEDEWDRLFAEKVFDLSVYWSGSAARSITNAKLPVGYVVPQEGAIGWFDGLSIGAGSANPEGAHLFLDYMIDPDFYVAWATKVGAPASVNPKANEKLPENDPVRQLHTNTTWISRLQFMAQLSDQERQSYTDLWTAVKQGLGK